MQRAAAAEGPAYCQPAAPEEGAGGRPVVGGVCLQKAGLFCQRRVKARSSGGQKLEPVCLPDPASAQVYIAKRPVPIRPQASCSHSRQAGCPTRPGQVTDLAALSELLKVHAFPARSSY